MRSSVSWRPSRTRPWPRSLTKRCASFGRGGFLVDDHASYAALNVDPDAWANLQKEVAVWDVTLADGLEVPLNEPDEGQGVG